MNTESKIFYDNITTYHEQTHYILKLIVDYFSENDRSCKKEFIAIRVDGYEVGDSNIELNKETMERISDWYKLSDKKVLEESIYKLDLKDEIYLFKLFEFGDGYATLAGYSLSNSVSVRSFLASFQEKAIKAKYEKLLSIM